MNITKEVLEIEDSLNKRITKKLNLELDTKSKKLNNAMEDLESKMSSNKDLMFDKEYVKVKKDTFNSMKKVIDETKKVMEVQPKLAKAFNDVNNYAQSYNALKVEKENVEKEMGLLRIQNFKLKKENQKLTDYIKDILEIVKEFFKTMLRRGNEDIKNETVIEVKGFYDTDDFKQEDVYDIGKDTTKEQELFDYADINKNYYKDKKDDFDISI